MVKNASELARRLLCHRQNSPEPQARGLTATVKQTAIAALAEKPRALIVDDEPAVDRMLACFAGTGSLRCWPARGGKPPNYIGNTTTISARYCWNLGPHISAALRVEAARE
jgi:hypothetical protein